MATATGPGSRPTGVPAGLADVLGGLGPVYDAENLVSAAQVLFDRGFGEVEAFRYLCVAQPLDDQFQYLSLTRPEGSVLCRRLLLCLVREILNQSPRKGGLSSCCHQHGAGYLLRLHLGVDKPAGTGPQSGPG